MWASYQFKGHAVFRVAVPSSESSQAQCIDLLCDFELWFFCSQIFLKSLPPFSIDENGLSKRPTSRAFVASEWKEITPSVGKVPVFNIHQGSKVMAFKVFVPHRRDTDESFRINAQRECTILRYLKSIRTSTLGHNLQISLSDSFENPNSHPQRDYFVMTELMDFTLAAVIEGSKADFRPSLVQNFMAQMLNGLSDLNSHHVIHRDLKPANILIRKTSTGYLVQLADFGLAYWDALPMADKNLKWHGDPGYRSPEALEATIRGYAGEQRGASGFPECADPELDCWALGCVLLDLLSKKAEGFTAVVPHNPADGPRPPLGIRTAANQALIRRMNLPVFLGTDQTRFNTLPLDIQCRLPWSKRDAYDLFTLLRMLLEEDPHKRWTVKEALAFPFIASVVHPLLRYHSLEKYSPDHRRGIRAKVLERRLLV
ncbi:kinase-like protein [Pseudohyphozyma bogoriensis]|nr:kinase-like protein [Pseudohyphozyma bogoriensis]